MLRVAHSRFVRWPPGLRWGLLLAGALAAWSARGQFVINEVAFNPPGPVDVPNEYVELRGPPNAVFPPGTFFLAVEGDAGGNPGTVQSLFDLSGRALGGNGFLLLLQQAHGYIVNSNAAILVNTNGSGWGSGATSSIGHRGEGGQTELENAAATFFLIQTTNPPSIGDDIDTNDDGLPDGPVWAAWTVLDSVGVLDNDGAGDIAYGAINFRRNPASTASGTVVPVPFTPGYVGRSTNSTGSTAADWVASDLSGTAPNWTLGGANTVPAAFAGAALNHLGSPNFGAASYPGVVVVPSGRGLRVNEGAGTSAYQLGLNTPPAGTVVIRITAPASLQISTDNGATWGAGRALSFNNTVQKTVLVRAPDDNVVDTSPHWAAVSHAITNTADAARYPTNALTPVVPVAMVENDWLVLNELKVNPPGTNDAPWEFIEIKGPPNALLTNVYLWVIESDGDNDAGEVDVAIALTSARLGASGLLVVGAPDNPYALPPNTTLWGEPRFSRPGGLLGNGSRSFLLVSTPRPPAEGTDLDDDDDGTLEDLPEGTTVLDSLAWSDGGANDLLYSPAALNLDHGTPDAASRYPGNTTPHSAEAWFYGNLIESGGDSLLYTDDNASPDFPVGSLLTPGTANNTAPTINALPPLAGTIGDPSHPQVLFAVDDAETPASLLVVTATSTNQSVVPDANLVITSGAGGLRTLTITPVGVGYTLITLTVSDGGMVGRTAFRYAASAMGRPGGRFHTAVSDGSTAFAVDTNLMFIGDDENQVLRLYKRHESGGPLASFDFTAYLGLTEFYPSGLPKEMDIESSARVGNRIYWLGSGSNAEWGEPHPNRNRVFATDISGSGLGSQLTFVGRYDHLIEDIIAWDANNQHGKGAHYYGLAASAAPGMNPKAEDGSGFNIEALTLAPGSSNVAYIGFRAPYVPPTQRAKALIVVVTNFDTLAVSGAAAGAARFGPPIELNLVRRGIRALASTSNAVLIVAGPAGQATDVSPSDFKLFTWTGRATDAPQERAADLTGLTPEGIVEVPAGPWSSNSLVQLISDNGVTLYYGDGVPAKRLPEPNFKKFRSDWVTLGPTVVSRPVLRALEPWAGQMRLSWYSIEGLTYRVQYRTSVGSGAWLDVPGDVTATDAVSWKLLSPAGPQCFYRVIVR